MNWTHYRQLVTYLERLREESPEDFDYGRDNHGHGPCGCVAHHISLVTGDDDHGPLVIAVFLNVTFYEACFLYGGDRDAIEPGCRNFFATNPDHLGRPGITEALRRLAVVAARHGGAPVEAPAPAPFRADDAAFLASVRALITAPLTEADS